MAVYVGVRELRENLRAYLRRARDGEEIVVTERGRPVARIGDARAQTKVEQLIAAGRVRPALRPRARLDHTTRVKPLRGTVSELVSEDRG